MKVLSSILLLPVGLVVAIAVAGGDATAEEYGASDFGTHEFSAIHQLWRSGGCATCVLRAADFRGADLSYMQLAEADLQGVKLYSEGPIPASLEGADLWSADLRDGDLRRVVLRGTNLHEANLQRANLFGADLRGADLTGADLRGANLEGAIGLVGDEYDVGAVPGDDSRKGLRGAVLSVPPTVVASTDVGAVFQLRTGGDREGFEVMLEGALYDEMTDFPAGFDPETAGMILAQ